MDYDAVFYIFVYSIIYHTMDYDATCCIIAYKHVAKHDRNTTINMYHTLHKVIILDHNPQFKFKISIMKNAIMNKQR